MIVYMYIHTYIFVLFRFLLVKGTKTGIILLKMHRSIKNHPFFKKIMYPILNYKGLLELKTTFLHNHMHIWMDKNS